MQNLIKVQLAELGAEVRATAIPDECKQSTLLVIGRLPNLYTQFGLTYESRYGEEIKRLVEAALNELYNSKTAFTQAEKLATSISERLRLLHERAGLPPLIFKQRPVATPRSRKAK